jgi:dihydroorotate dehydrogenase (NAD+) catalytic subunit
MPKRDLIFSKPLMNAAGMLGFAPDSNAPVPWEDLGAFITNPISMRPRTAAESPALLKYPGGFLFHSGLPNPGFGAGVTQYARRWAGSPLPIIVHLMADRPEESREMVQVLEGLENVMAIELGFAPLLADDIILLAVEMSRGELPLIVCLQGEQILRLGPRTLQQGATALSLAAPRGTLSRDGRTISGRLFGPSLFPMSLGLVRAAAAAGLPTIGAGGVFSKSNADAMVAVGAIGVQLDTQLWLPHV